MRRTGFVLLLVAAVAGCRRPAAPASAPVPLPSNWEHCWWTVMRSTLSVDSVGSSFRRAFVTLGQSNVHWTKNGDTVFVRAGPAPLLPSEVPWDTASYGATYWARIAAFPQNDSTRFRLYVSIVRPSHGWAQPSDSVHAFRPIGLCAEIGKVVAFRWIRRVGDPGDEEKLPVWSRVP
ncbi:MAG TPA: hypothetical protein VGQ30_12565 [Gemmatimonadaceae bacterium]|nr:hypothetical protein [Gemmatimonadaceae bacterium]